MDDIAGAIERSLEQSLERLQSGIGRAVPAAQSARPGVGERVALTPEQVLGRGGVADTFDRLKEQGLIHASGITVAGDTAACLEVIDSGRFDAAQVYYNAINPSAAWRRPPPGWRGGRTSPACCRACFQQNMGVLNIRVWAGGLLASPSRRSACS